MGTAPTSPERLEAECVHLRTELDRKNDEIAKLKRGRRNVGDDYWLREKMADAEVLARKLTDAETRLRGLRGGAVRGAAPSLFATQPAAGPGDTPFELEAKADLLADQALRLASEADSLTRRADQIRSRQTLRRRAGALERDPFAGLDASRRSIAVGPRQSSASGDVQSDPAKGSPSTISASPAESGMASLGDERSPQPATAPLGGSSANMPSSIPGAPATPASAVSVQLRSLLDPAALADVQRLERAGNPRSDADVLERAASALRARSRLLQAQAKDLRAKAKP